MSDEIVKKLPDWFVGRMRAWASFRVHSGAYAVPSSWPSDGPMPRGDGFGTRNWRLMGSVHETQVEIDRLPGRFRQAVAQYWILEGYGHSLRDHARKRQVSHPTFITWLRKGHAMLFLAFRAARDRRKAQAEEARAVGIPRAA